MSKLIKNYKLKIGNFLKNLQSKPDEEKKKIIMAVTIFVGVLMVVFWWLFIFKNALKNLNKENLEKSFNAQELKDKVKNIK